MTCGLSKCKNITHLYFATNFLIRRRQQLTHQLTGIPINSKLEAARLLGGDSGGIPT